MENSADSGNIYIRHKLNNKGVLKIMCIRLNTIKFRDVIHKLTFKGEVKIRQLLLEAIEDEDRGIRRDLEQALIKLTRLEVLMDRLIKKGGDTE